MPIIHVNMLEGRTLEQKRKLVTGITEAVMKSLGVNSEAVHIVLHDLPKHNIAHAGILTSDKK